jgi:hypothetical protein
VKLLLPPDCPVTKGTRVHVRFTYDRYGYRFLHAAVDNFPRNLGRLIFPTPTSLGSRVNGGEEARPLTDQDIRWREASVNQEQRQAIKVRIQALDGLEPARLVYRKPAPTFCLAGHPEQQPWRRALPDLGTAR